MTSLRFHPARSLTSRSSLRGWALVITLLGMNLSACGDDVPDPSEDDLGAGGTISGTGGANVGGSQVGETGGQAPGMGGSSISSGGASASGGSAGNGAGGTQATGGLTGSGGLDGTGGLAGTGGTEASGGADGSGGLDGTGGGADEYSPCPTDGSDCAILPLGDSITEGYGSSGGGYRVELFREAISNGKSITFVGSLQNGPSLVDGQSFPRNHQGHGGFTIDSDAGHSGISGQITDDALENYHPHIVLLMIGTNDINGNVDINGAPGRLGALIDDITSRAPETLVVVASVCPVINNGTNDKVIAYNLSVKDVVQTRSNAGDHVAFVDNYAAIYDSPDWQNALMIDNLHPNDAGYSVFGQSFYSAIEAFLP